MTNVKKIGFSALAGALAMTSAHAGELAVSGSMAISYTQGGGYHSTGNPLGQANDLSFAASTELDNGVTVAYTRTTGDTGAFDDSELAFGNIAGGTIAMTSTGSPLSGIDDVTPTAFEEANAQTGSITTVAGVSGDFGIRYTLDDVAGTGIKFDYMYVPTHGTDGATGDQAVSGASHGKEHAHDVAITATPIDGLSLGLGYMEKSYDLTAPMQNSAEEATAYLTYATGAITVGAQVAGVSQSGLGHQWYKTTMAGISYAISDDLSVSYNQLKSKKSTQDNAYAAGTQQEFDSISLSYSVGGMTIGISDSDCSNCSYTSGRTQDETTVALSVAF